MEPDEIRAIRDRLGLTQGQFGQLLGLQAATVSRWENPADPLRPTPYQVALMQQFDRAGRAQPRPRDSSNDIVIALVTAGAAVALGLLLMQAIQSSPRAAPRPSAGRRPSPRTRSR